MDTPVAPIKIFFFGGRNNFYSFGLMRNSKKTRLAVRKWLLIRKRLWKLIVRGRHYEFHVPVPELSRCEKCNCKEVAEEIYIDGILSLRCRRHLLTYGEKLTIFGNDSDPSLQWSNEWGKGQNFVRKTLAYRLEHGI